MKFFDPETYSIEELKETLERFGMSKLMTTTELEELVWNLENSLYSIVDAAPKVIILPHLFDQTSKAAIRLMLSYLEAQISTLFNNLRHALFSLVSLLFGLCSSQSSLILNAFFGNSLSRIPSI